MRRMWVVAAAFAALTLWAQVPQTVPEATGYKATSTAAEVDRFLLQLAKAHPERLLLTTFGSTAEGRPLRLAIAGDPAPAGPEANTRPVLLLVGNIHGGEVEGKEALQILLRDLLQDDRRGVLKAFTLLVVPVFNVDGNEKIDPANRPYQRVEKGVGQRTNGANLDLNRDFVKLDTPEVRALVRLFDRWDPLAVADLHTTNGSFHEEPLTWIWSRTPYGSAEVRGEMAEKVYPFMAALAKREYGLDSLPYGDFDDDLNPRAWRQGPPSLRLGVEYFGAKGAYAFLDETYAHADFPTRVKAARAFLEGLLRYALANRERMVAAKSRFRRDTAPAFYPAFTAVAFPAPLTIRAFKAEAGPSRHEPINTGVRVDVTVPFEGDVKAEPVPVGAAYLLPPGLGDTVERLRAHGLKVFRIVAPVKVSARTFRIDSVAYGDLPNQGRVGVHEVKGSWRDEPLDAEGWWVVPLGPAQLFRVLAPALLEPESRDGFLAHGLLSNQIYPHQWTRQPGDYPVRRLASLEGLTLELPGE